MKPANKHIVIYADGRIRESKDELVGRYLHEAHNGPNGDEAWERQFEIHAAVDEPDREGQPKNLTMVAVQVDDRRIRDAEQQKQWEREFAEELRYGNYLLDREYYEKKRNP